MADTIAVTEGSGKIVATDDISVDGTLAGQVQFMKLVDGTLNGTGSIRVNQAAKANALTVAPASDISDATYIGDIKFGESLPAGTNEIGKLAAGTAAIGKLAANSGVDIGDVTLTAGTNAFGKLSANSGVDIGDVDVTSIVPLTGATNLGKARDSALGATDTGVMALAVRDDTLTTLTPADGDYVPLRVSSTGQLHVTGGGGGTEYTEDVATANPIVGSAIMFERDDIIGGLTPAEGDWASMRCSAEGALWVQDFNSDAALAHLATIAGDTTSLDTKIVVGGGAEAGAVLVTIANNSTGLVSVDDGASSLTVDTTGTSGLEVVQVTAADLNVTEASGVAIKNAVEIIDDWDATHASAASADGPQLMAAYDATKPTAVTDNQSVRVLADEYGRLLSGVEKTAFSAVYDSANATAEAEVVHASAASTIIVVQSYIISSDVEGWIKLQDEDSTAKTGKFWLKAGGGVAITLPDKAPIVLGVDKDLEVIAEAVGDVSVTVTGYTIPG